MRDKANRTLSPKVIIVVAPTGIDTIRCVCSCEAEEIRGKRFLGRIRGLLGELNNACQTKEKK